MRRFEILTDWDGWHRMEMVLGVCFILFGVLVTLFPKLLVLLFAALCIGAGLALVYAAFKGRHSTRAYGEGPGFTTYSSW